MPMNIVEKASLVLAGKALPDGEQRGLVSELLTTADAQILIPRVIQATMLEAAEPVYWVSKFFQTIRITEGRTITFPSIGALRAERVGEGMEYPNAQLTIAEHERATTTVSVDKYGLMVQITDEMVSDSQWDVIGMHIRAAGRAMARKLEEMCYEEFDRAGYIIFDNKADATTYPHLTADQITALKTTGTDEFGQANGTMSAEDVIRMCIGIMAWGFNPTDIIMHPLCYSMFLQNQWFKNFGLPAFGGNAPTYPGIGNVGNASPNVPQQLPWPGITISFAPWVPFDHKNKTFSMYVLDRNNIGVHLVKDDITTERFDNPERDIVNMKVKARWGVGLVHGGRAVAVAKNIVLDTTHVLPPMYRTYDVTPSA